MVYYCKMEENQLLVGWSGKVGDRVAMAHTFFCPKSWTLLAFRHVQKNLLRRDRDLADSKIYILDIRGNREY